MINFNVETCTLDGVNLIEASAGTGKTHNISKLFIRLLVEKKLLIENILVVTFTEAATEELRTRIRNELKDTIKSLNPENKETHEILEYAINNFDESSIFTIHGFCRKVLQENAFESSNLFDTELITDQNILLKDIIDDFWRIFTSNESGIFIEYIYKSGINSDTFFNLIRTNIARPFLSIIPEIKYLPVKEPETDYIDIFMEVKNIWKDSAYKISNLLNSAGLNKTKYSDKIKNELFKNLTIFFESANNIHIKLFNKFEKLTSDYIGESTKKGYDCPSHIFFDKCAELLSANKKLQDLYNNNLLYFKRQVFDYVKTRLDLRKKKQNIQFFDDLLTNVYSAVCKGKFLINSINKIYKAALIDEFQDTDPLQYFIFKKIFNNSILFFIGDPKQAIYSFRGADIYAYLEALKTSANIYTLEKNWRSEKNLVNAVNTLFSNRENPFLMETIKFITVKSAPDINIEQLTYKGESASSLNIAVLSNTDEKSITKEQAVNDSIKFIVNQIKHLLTDKDIKLGQRNIVPEDIAVLVRTNMHAIKVQKELNKSGIPGVLYSTENLLESDEAVQLNRILAAIADPINEKKIIAALTTDFYANTWDEMFQLIDDPKILEKKFEDFHKLNVLWSSNSFIKMITFWMSQNFIRSKLLRFNNGERRLTNLLHLIEVLHNAIVKNQLCIDGIVEWLSSAILEPEKHMEHQIRLETDEHAVKLVTIHKAKGLQYPIVFCPFLWYARSSRNYEFIFHDKSGKLYLDLGSEQIDSNEKIFKMEELSESIRLTYVALTRARNSCYIITGKIKGTENSGLSYLLFPSGKNIWSELDTMKYPDIIKNIKNLEEKSDNTIKYLRQEEHPYTIYNQESTQEEKLKLRTAEIIKTHNYRITSFSSLTHVSHNKYETRLEYSFGIDYDNNSIKYNMEDKVSDYMSIHTFPKGAKTGLLVHSIFEEIDFNKNTEEQKKELIKQRLINSGYDENWLPAVFSMTETVLNTALGKDQIRLSSITKDNIIKEMEFLFPLKRVNKQDFLNCFKEISNINKVFLKSSYSNIENSGSFLSRISELSFNPLEGYVKGFIDLVLKYNNKYYIVDWKTNYLGETTDDYNIKNMSNAILEEYYFLQYYLYALALDKYLSVNLKDYSYKSNFGGIYYLFVRGINSSNSNGVFFDLPDEEIMQKLDKLLIGS